MKKIKNKKEVVQVKQEVTLPKRFVSYLIDWYVGALATAFPISIISQKLYGTMTNQYVVEFPEPLGLIGAMLGLFCAFLYFVIVPTFITPGQTLGKRLCKIKIVKNDGSKATFKNLFLRQVIGMAVIEGVLISASAIWHQAFMIVTKINIVTPLMYVGFVVSAISIGLLLIKKEHRALHDYIGNTKVVVCE